MNKYIFKYTLEFFVIVTGISLSFWINEWNNNRSNSDKELFFLNGLKNDLDILVVDTPAGASDASVEFSAACDAVVIVLVPEPTSFMDAYSFIKALYLEKKFESVSIVVNLAKNEKAAKKSYDSFKKIVTKFLSVDLKFLGWLPESKAIAGSIVARKPAVLQKSLEPILQKNFAEIANNLVKLEAVKSSGVKFFNSK